MGQPEEEVTEEANAAAGERPPRPMMVWIVGTIAYVAIVVLAGLVLSGINPDSTVFPPLLTALAGLFVATAINVRTGPGDDDEEEWNRFQTHAIVVAISSMVLSIGLVMCALAFPGELIFRLAFWGSAIAILIGASFLLATVWERLSADKTPPVSRTEPEPATAPDTEPEVTPEPAPAAAEESSVESGREKTDKSKLRRAPQADLVAETLKKSKKSKKSGKKKSKSRDSKKKK